MVQTWSADELLEMARGIQPGCVLVAAAELDVFTALGNQPKTASRLATELQADPRATAVLLDALVALGMLTKRGNAYEVPPGVAGLLTEGSPASILAGLRHQGNYLRRWMQLARVVQTGRPAERSPSIRGETADCESFIGAMDNFAAPIAPRIVEILGPPRFERMLDVGGASGTWTIAFLLAVPDATAVLFDLPEVIPLARERLTCAGLADRVTLVAGDYNSDPLPAGADFAWLSAIAHQNSRDENLALYAKIHAALNEDGTLVIRDVVMDPDRTTPIAGALFAVNMLVGTERGGTYSLQEFTEDLRGAGFAEIGLVHWDDSMNSLIRARKC